ncbi:MAG: hypothetical protein NC489_25580 [Ruminococcus flavefaciens]|nr:hypothetical protein [Ruminococcus flavefaciens]
MGPENKLKVIDTFEIPDELAHELSDLLTKQVIKERLLLQLLNDPEKYEQVENMLVPITARIEAIKFKISNEYVPDHYRFAKYQWNYNGYEIDANRLDVQEIVQ